MRFSDGFLKTATLTASLKQLSEASKASSAIRRTGKEARKAARKKAQQAHTASHRPSESATQAAAQAAPASAAPPTPHKQSWLKRHAGKLGIGAVGLGGAGYAAYRYKKRKDAAKAQEDSQ